MKEPPLYQQQGIDYAVRLTYFGRRENLVLRFDKEVGGTARSQFNKFSLSADGVLNPEAVSRSVHTVTSDDFSRLMTEIERRDFFSLGPADAVATSGGVYLLEVYDGQRYHLTKRTIKGDPAWDVARTVTEIAGVTEFGS